MIKIIKNNNNRTNNNNNNSNTLIIIMKFEKEIILTITKLNKLIIVKMKITMTKMNIYKTK